jgi:hypothetical protein
MKAKKCKGCGPATAEGAADSKCPVRKCAASCKIAFCGTGCKGFLKCKKVTGRTYAQTFVDTVAKKMA